jgi:Flp pilus assembly pilin Flp
MAAPANGQQVVLTGRAGHRIAANSVWRDGELKMSKFVKLLDRLRKDEEGASMAEYVVLLGVITAGVIAVITAFAGQITAKFNAVCNSLTGGAGGC